MLRPIIHKSQMLNRVAVPYGMLDDIAAALNACGIEIANVLRRPYVQLQPNERATVMADLDTAGFCGRRLVIEATGNVDDMRAFVRDRLSDYDCPEQVTAVPTPYDKAYACNTFYSELIDCYYDSIAHNDIEAADEERRMLQSMWAEYEQTMSAAIDYARKTDDIATDLALTPLLEHTRRRLLDNGVIGSSL